MLKLSIRSLTAHKLRFGLTTFAVLLGVSFIVSSFVIRDGLMRTFTNIVDDANAAVDVEIRSADEFAEIDFGDRPFDEAVYDQVLEVDGVREAIPIAASVKVVPLKADGSPIEAFAPIFAFNWSASELDALDLVTGKIPDGPGQFALDEGTADREDFVVGETYELVGVEGREPFELVGLSRFGEENALAGAVLVSLTLDEVQRLDGSEGQLLFIDIAAEEGEDIQGLITRLELALPADVEAVTGEVVADEDKDDFAFFVDIFGNVLLGFALVAVFVSIFIIGNTFNILLGQRVRELALLRALGASSRQVRFSAILESLIVGISASVLGLGGGVLLALGIRAMLGSLGLTLPSMDIILAPRTIIIAVIVGIGVTLMASLTPTRRAAKVPPIAAMRAGFRFGSGEGTRRTIIAVVLSVFGVALMAIGLFGGGSTSSVLMSLGLGAVLLFVAVRMYAPLFSSPSASFLGRPLEHLPGQHVTGHMARENAARDNKRTAATAAGLMIGLALIAMGSVVAESLKETFRADLGSTMIADYVITADNDAEFSNQVAGQVDAMPEFDSVSAVRYGNMRIDGDDKGVVGADLTTLTDLMAVGVQSGDPAASANAESIVLTQEAADENGVVVGDKLTVEFAATGWQVLTVGAIYENDFIIGHYLIDLSAWDQNFDSESDAVISARVAEGVDASVASAALAPLESAFPQLNFETRQEFNDRIEGTLDNFLIIINVMLGLAIIIALLGITNTMALSVLERTREIGLMRAIGMTRRQTKSMIRLEAAIVSLFGALLGVLVGLAFGWLAVLAIPESIINQLAIPAWTLVLYVIIATLAGLLAASFPARRAARLNVLDAIAHE
ncbi:ABC transporter permease [Ilumatobacter sp.]|uniref:ABC transporter permease n=1 Tax=Ilumatobacter sp. TaxID=1967498 RepID=UPI003AF763E9